MKLSGKFSETLEAMDEKQKLYAFWGILLLVFVLDYLFLMGPQIGTLTKLNPKIEVLKNDLNETNTNLQRVAQYRKDIQRLKEEVELANMRVTPREEVPLILESISRLANKNGITINQLNPSSADEELILESGDRNYYNLPIIVDAEGGYHDFGAFLNEIEVDEIFMRVFTYSISATKNLRKHRINLNIKAIIYAEVEKQDKG